MEILFKYISAVIASLCGLLCPIAPLVTTAILFVVVDFVTGIIASCVVARREGRPWWFESRKAWRTVAKAGFVAIAIVMMWIIDHYLLEFMHLNLANLFTGFVCGVELWSFLENAQTISGSSLFEWMGRWVRRRVGEEVEDE
ncbi:MAG: phage holin family protein [Rikenellaceae bacterium]|nr:phage holin family protein [Rikenellaceae bacterium]